MINTNIDNIVEKQAVKLSYYAYSRGFYLAFLLLSKKTIDLRFLASKLSLERALLELLCSISRRLKDSLFQLPKGLISPLNMLPCVNEVRKISSLFAYSQCCGE